MHKHLFLFLYFISMYLIYKQHFYIYIYTCTCLYLHIHNKYTQHTHIYHVNKTFILDVNNRLTALIYVYIYIYIYGSRQFKTFWKPLLYTMVSKQLYIYRQENSDSMMMISTRTTNPPIMEKENDVKLCISDVSNPWKIVNDVITNLSVYQIPCIFCLSYIYFLQISKNFAINLNIYIYILHIKLYYFIFY